jgi:DNA-binding winged helix-turn-helix (wHTH) protein
MDAPALREPFRLGDHCIQPAANEIDGQRIDGKAMQVLVCLARAAPDVVTHSELLESVWPNVVVGDNVLHQAVAHLRKALSDEARAPRYIENIPRRGYRLLAEVQRGAAEPGAVAPPPAKAPRSVTAPAARPLASWIAAAVVVLVAVLYVVGQR